MENLNLDFYGTQSYGIQSYGTQIYGTILFTTTFCSYHLDIINKY